MAIEFIVQKWGNSAAVRLPAPILAQLDLRLGDKVIATVCPEGLMLKPVKQKIYLDDLLVQCQPTNNLPDDINLWDNVTPVGREIW